MRNVFTAALLAAFLMPWATCEATSPPGDDDVTISVPPTAGPRLRLVSSELQSLPEEGQYVSAIYTYEGKPQKVMVVAQAIPVGKMSEQEAVDWLLAMSRSQLDDPGISSVRVSAPEKMALLWINDPPSKSGVRQTFLYAKDGTEHVRTFIGGYHHGVAVRVVVDAPTKAIAPEAWKSLVVDASFSLLHDIWVRDAIIPPPPASVDKEYRLPMPAVASH